MVDPAAVHAACRPLARWWNNYQHGQPPDPARLAHAAARAQLLGPVPGPLGAALTYILDGCPDLNYPKLHAAFTYITDASHKTALTAADLHTPGATTEQPVTQLCFSGMAGPAAISPHPKAVRR